MPDLLIEIGCEELPSSACREALEQVPALAAGALEALRLPAGTPEVWVAPRRIALFVADLPAAQTASSRSVRGPSAEAAFDADGRPTKAAQGFARAQGVAPEDLVVREEPASGRRFAFAEVTDEARPLDELVPELARRVLEGIRFGKTMRWGDGAGLRFSRPVRWIVAKLDERTVPFTLHGLEAGGVSRGHRFLGGPADVGHARAYRDALLAAGVVADHAERLREITAGLDAAAEVLGGRWRDPAGKMAEVLFLVERPSVICGRIADRHLTLPARVLVTAMQSHQRYFPVEREDASLLPAFLAVSNGDPAHAELITRGNEDVLDARLQDAAFSYARDREAGLAALDARLDAIVFHKRLGTLAQKRDRLVAGVGELAATVGAPPDVALHAEGAARLAKVDQGAVLVAEFSELEGFAAAHYAGLEDVPEAVCAAIGEQYMPDAADSPLPATGAGALLAAAERIDNLVGAFLVDEAPSGSRDPYALRRAATGLVRIALDRGWDAPVRPLLAAAAARLRAQGADLALGDEPALDALEAFIADRLAYLLAGEGVGAEAAAAAEGAHLGSLPATAAWARAIEQVRDTPELVVVWTACTRCQKLAQKGPAGAAFAPAGDPGEDALHAAIEAARPRIAEARARRDFGAALDAARHLAPAVDRFFEDVMVNVDDEGVRARRYGLVGAAAGLLTEVADFSRITIAGGGR